MFESPSPSTSGVPFIIQCCDDATQNRRPGQDNPRKLFKGPAGRQSSRANSGRFSDKWGEDPGGNKGSSGPQKNLRHWPIVEGDWGTAGFMARLSKKGTIRSQSGRQTRRKEKSSGMPAIFQGATHTARRGPIMESRRPSSR